MPEPRDQRLFAAVVAASAVPLTLLADAAVAAWLGWRPYGAVEHAVLALAALALAAVAAAVAVPGTRAALRAHWAEATLLCVSGAAAWLMAEVLVAKSSDAFQVKGLFHTRGPSIHKVFEPAPGVMPGVQGPARYTTDVTGVRTPGVDREGYPYHILCIGGSTTECVYLDDTETWPALLMQRLNEAYGENRVWVGNIGFSGFATLDHIRFLQSSKLLKDFDCVVIQPGVNDLYPVLAGEPLRVHINRNIHVQGARPLWARSNIIQFYHDLRRTVPIGAGIESRDGAEYVTRRDKRRAAPIRDELPDLAPAIRAYQERLRTIVRLCREKSLRMLFVTQPVLWDAQMSDAAEALCWFGWLQDGAYLSTAKLRDAIDRYNAALIAVCKEMDTPCVDLSGMNGNEAFLYDDCHLTETGAREVAQLVAEAYFSTFANSRRALVASAFVSNAT